MENLETITRLVCEIAREAGSYIREERQGFSFEAVECKHAHDYVSYVDKGSERRIVQALREVLPEAGFITEEGTAIADVSTQYSGFTWVVDPLDGTTNFIHGFVPYAVSIALMRDKEIVVGVVYEVCADECFYAWQGGGAYLNGCPISVGHNAINDALVCLQLPYNSTAYLPIIQHLIQHFYGHVGSIRMIGSAAIALEEAAATLGDMESAGCVLASDGFFPFDDCVTLAAKYGIKAIVQPGGSVRDEDSVKKADECGIAMVFTHERHFRH